MMKHFCVILKFNACHNTTQDFKKYSAQSIKLKSNTGTKLSQTAHVPLIPQLRTWQQIGKGQAFPVTEKF